MDWTYLGHAMWLVEAAGLRLLCDPLLAPTHHCGVFEVVPHRDVDAAALRPDFVLVSHRHPDHFDVASLHRLAQLDPHTVVVTPDSLVVEAATRLGFRTVRRVAPGTLVELDGLRLVTTPSVDPREWGVMIACDGAAAWNQVDTVFRGPADAVRVRDAALEALGAARLDFAAVRWQPMLEIAAQLGTSTEFPLDAYDRVLREIAAVAADAIVPAAAGSAHVGPWSWLDHVVFPVGEARLLRDLALACPRAHLFASTVGTTWRVDGDGATAIPGGGARWVTARPGVDRRSFAPMHIPALVDPNPSGGDVGRMRQTVQAWLRGTLREGLAPVAAALAESGPRSLVVEVIWPDAAQALTFVLEGGAVTVREGGDDDWDAINQVAGSLLWEVVVGRRGWGDVLLAGALRGRTRAYRVGSGGATALPLAPLFLYYGLDYDDSHERAVRWELDALVGPVISRGPRQ